VAARTDTTNTTATPQLNARPALNGRPMSEDIYERLRDAICAGTYLPETKLVQDQLATDLGVSRTPVREALSRLTQEEYLRRVPGMGYFVREPNLAEMREVYQVRRALEPVALRLAWPHYADRDIAVLRQLDAESARSLGTDQGYYDANRRFHLALITPCPNQLLVRTITELFDLPVKHLMSRDSAEQLRPAQEWRDEHTLIVDALAAGDSTRAVELLDRHLDQG
jgi:DNA-binding GntR family transcriptional regulator